MSQRDISEQIKSLYDVDISPELVSKISDKIMPEGDSMAGSSSGAIVSFRLSRCHPLQGQGGSAVSNKGYLCGFGHHHGWAQGRSGRMDW